MLNTLAKIRCDSNEILLSSPCFFNEEELERMGVILEEPFEQNGITYIYQLLKGE